MHKINLEKAILSFDKVMGAARKRVDGDASNYIGDNQAIGILRMLKLDDQLKNVTIYTKLAEQLNVDPLKAAQEDILQAGPSGQ